MSIASRIEAIEQHLTDDYNVLEVAGADLTNVDKNILNLKPTWQERLLYFMNNGTQQVWDNWDKVTGEGTTITLNNTEEAPMKIDLKGNTSQETTTGNNLLIPHAQATASTNGITRTTNADGSITLTGTATANAYLRISEPIQLQSSTTYTTLIQDRELPANVTLYYNYLENIGTDYVSTYMPPSTRAKTYTTGNVTGTINIAVLVQSGASVNVTLKPMLVKGTYTTSNIPPYEPYTNGASPNPDYPQDIHVVSGDNSINVCGKNLFNINTALTKRYISYANGNVGTSDDWSASDFIQIQGNTNYILSGITNSGWTAGTGFYDINKNFISSIYSTVYSFTTPSNAKYVRLSLRSETPTGVMLEKGSTATTYEEYKGASYPISLMSKNIFDDSVERKNAFPSTTVGSTITYTNSGATYSYVNGAYLKAGETYTISWTQTTTPASTNGRAGAIVDENNIVLQGIGTWINSANYITFTPASTGYLVVSTDINATNIQIEKGSQATEYVEYNSIELCKIGDYQDSIVKDNGKWYLNKQIGKVVLNGSESGWLERGNTSENYIKFRNANALPYDSKGDLLLISDYFVTNIGANNASYSGNAICGNSGNYAKWLHISIDNTIVNSVETFKTWLSTHNTTVYYALQTPTYTEITGELLSQLNALAKSYNSQTNISQESNDLASILNATALREMS